AGIMQLRRRVAARRRTVPPTDHRPGDKPFDTLGALSLSKRRRPYAPFGAGYHRLKSIGQLHDLASALQPGLKFFHFRTDRVALPSAAAPRAAADQRPPNQPPGGQRDESQRGDALLARCHKRNLSQLGPVVIW